MTTRKTDPPVSISVGEKVKAYPKKDLLKAAPAARTTGRKKTVHNLPVQKPGRDRRATGIAQLPEAEKTSQEKYLDLYDFAPVGYFTLDGKGTILDVNLTGTTFLSRPRKEVISHNFLSFLTPESYPFFSGFLAATSETGEQHVCELELAGTKDNPPRFIRIEGTAWLNKKKTLDRIQIAVSDITVQKKVEAQLIESEEWFRRLFETAQDAILIIDGDSGMITHANRYILDLSGYPLDFFIGKHLPELGIIKDKDLAKNTCAELQKNRYIRYEDLALETRRGMIIQGELTGNLYLVGDKRIIQINIRDITERKDAQNLLLASELRYRRLFETAQDGILILDEETGTIIDANPFIVNLLGYPLGYFVGRHLWELGFIKDKALARTGFSELKTKGYVRYDDLPLETKDGRAVDVEFVSNVYPVDHHKIIQCNIRDITSRKRADDALREVKEYLENLIGYANAPIIVWNPRSEITEFNHAFEVLTGLNRQEVLGQPLSILFPAESREKSLDLIRQTLEGERWETVEIPIRNISGDTHIVLWNSSNILDTGGKVIATIAQGLEITERKQAEFALALANRKLNLLSRITRHDILNQLAILQGYLELSSTLPDLPAAQKDLIGQEQKTANTIRHQILFTRDYQNMGMKAPAWQNISATFRHAVTRHDTRDIKVDVGQAEVEVFADPLFEKVADNLIDNALRYGGSSLRSIRISSQETGPGLTITCEDDGEGILPEDRIHLFERGFGKHTGLGLFLSREILSITGIAIAETSVADKGARFEIHVPKGLYRFTGK
jgi:PAS domain S-box-containing protein